MKILIFVISFIWTNGFVSPRDSTCGIDRSPATVVYEGDADIETYPWMGLLVYPFESGVDPSEVKTSAVVLITAQLALATALDIDRYPKLDFRKSSRVILGHNCTGPYHHVEEYNFHPDFGNNYYSSLAMLQIRVTLTDEFIPICAPPKSFDTAEIFAMTVKHDCSTPMLKIYLMEYVSLDKCKEFYRRNDLDVESMWPRHVACAQSKQGGECLWQSGTMLVSKQYGRWRLLGVGIYGPGCEAPARFLDYDMYHEWVRKSVSGIGKVAVTRMAPDHLIMRRSGSKIQRYGPCDPEEVQREIYSDETMILTNNYTRPNANGTVRYNITLYAKVEYSCVSVRVWYVHETEDTMSKASIRLRNWCHADTPLCAQTQYISIFFYVEITFKGDCRYEINAYGTELKQIDPKKALVWANRRKLGPKLIWPVTKLNYK